MLFNEAEVLAAIEAAEALDAQRTTIIAADASRFPLPLRVFALSCHHGRRGQTLLGK